MRRIYLLTGLVSIALFGLAVATTVPCTPVRSAPPERGSHGFRLWQGPTLKSFEHGNGPVCIPSGWEAVGAVSEGPGWARFSEGAGVIIRSRDFTSMLLTIPDNPYAVTLTFPVRSPSEKELQYEATVRNAFEKVGALYQDSGTHALTVLVTAGLGTSGNERDSIYPDPNERVNFLILPPEQVRSEELFIHAIAHLYNRFRPDLDAYEQNATPLSAIDFQEMEAAWSETALESDNGTRGARFDYLYSVHQAVAANDFSKVSYAPFADPDAFAKLHASLPTDEKTFSPLDYQYSHYVLAPLVLAGIDGLLEKYGAKTDVASLLAELHAGKIDSLFGELRKLLPASAMNEIGGWMQNRALIPRALINSAQERYDRN